MNDTRNQAGAATGLLDAPEREDVATKTILLLDSVEVFLRFEQTILQRRDWRVLRAKTGGDALDVLASERVDLLVMDHVLPDLHGEHVIRAIRSSAQIRRMPILMVTANGDRAAVERCMEEGCNAFLYKPVSRQALCSKVEQLLAVPARRHVRTLVRLQVDTGEGTRSFFGNTVNLSVGGMLVESANEMEAGDSLDLRFHLPGDSRPIVVLARVARVAPIEGAMDCGGHVGLGLEFEQLDEEDRRRIETFVRVCQGAAPDDARAAC